MKTFWLILLCWLAASGAFAQERRLALVVGIGAYQHHDPLRNADADADLIAKALERAGFAVTSEHDVGQSQFEHALATFEKKIGPTDTALIYFSGHALQAANRNVMLAADSQGASGVPFFKLLDATDRAKFRILILDACRDGAQGTKATAGLKPEYPKGETAIIFSAEAGTEATDGAGPHSPFAASLARHLSDGLELAPMMRLVAEDVHAATNGQNPEMRVGGATAFYFGASFAIEPGLNEPARLIARELEAQFERAGFAPELGAADDRLRRGLGAFDPRARSGPTRPCRRQGYETLDGSHPQTAGSERPGGISVAQSELVGSQRGRTNLSPAPAFGSRRGNP